MLKGSLKYSIACGVFLVIVYQVSSYFGLNPQINVAHLIFDAIIFGLFVFFAQKEFKTYENGGVLHFWQGMTLGFIVYATGSVIFILTLIIFFLFDVDAVIKYQEEATNFLNSRADMYKEQFGEAGFSRQLEEIKSVTASDLIMRSALKKLLAGFFVTPVISIILRKQPK